MQPSGNKENNSGLVNVPSLKLEKSEMSEDEPGSQNVDYSSGEQSQQSAVVVEHEDAEEIAVERPKLKRRRRESAAAAHSRYDLPDLQRSNASHASPMSDIRNTDVGVSAMDARFDLSPGWEPVEKAINNCHEEVSVILEGLMTDLEAERKKNDSLRSVAIILEAECNDLRARLDQEKYGGGVPQTMQQAQVFNRLQELESSAVVQTRTIRNFLNQMEVNKTRMKKLANENKESKQECSFLEIENETLKTEMDKHLTDMRQVLKDLKQHFSTVQSIMDNALMYAHYTFIFMSVCQI